MPMSDDIDALLADIQARRQRQIANGEVCYACGAYNGLLRTPGRGQLCDGCQALRDDPSEAAHGSRIRCPRCRSTFKLFEDDYYELLEEGEHEFTCPECAHTFEIVTSVSYSFRSPALEPEEEDDEFDEEDDCGEDNQNEE
jgi:uncharacterized protein YbaR (Trm112 family)